ncbi:MAG: RNA-binding protein [Lachnospiraceae bacterium]|nr:RNA-binding protein [Lachnospiraceae bacterium]
MEQHLGYLNYRLEGGFPVAERKKVFFYPPEYSDTQMQQYVTEQICYLYITPVAPKFADALTHRDFLGAIMNLGISRSRIGDIFIQDTSAYCICDRAIGVYIQTNLRKIKHTMIKAELRDSLPENFQIPFKQLKGSIASLRVDAFIAFVFHFSRSQAISLIQAEKVFVQGKLVRTGSDSVKELQIVSVRGHGRFRFERILGQTKKERLYVEVSLYQ